MSSDSSEDAFENSPLPVKRRKLNPPTFDDSESEGGRFQPDTWKGSNKKHLLQKETPNTTDGEQRTAKQPTKPKHRVHIHANSEVLEDQFFTQGPDLISSSPWRIRGARWQKPSKAVAAPSREEKPADAITNQGRDASVDNSCSAESRVSAINYTATSIAEQALKQRTSFSSSRSVKSNIPSRMESATADPTTSKQAFDFAAELADLPSDAFASSSSSPQKSPGVDTHEVVLLSSQQRPGPARPPNLVAPRNGLQQMTLFGAAASKEQTVNASTTNKKHNWPLINREEPPTHHKLDLEAMKTYVYPTNLGKIRDYQFSIVKRALYHNLLVALPTGLGKTFIAATIMLNWWRWTRDAQIVFVAPTRPLVSQQVDACFGIAGIPRSQTSMLTGTVQPGLRAEEWASKRVFFTTPQTIANDLKTGICDPKRLVLLVVDEAHRATGNYSYVELVRFLRRFNVSFRILALTATPGASVESVQEVINGLFISRIEIRTEFSIDIREYVYTKTTNVITFDNSEEMERVMDLFSKALSPLVQQLRAQNSYWTADPMMLTAYGLTQARQKWMTSAGRNANAALKGMINRIFTVLATLAHSIELLKYHGIGPFYHNVLAFQNSLGGVKGGKYEQQIVDSGHFRKMMTEVGFWIRDETFISHPKLEHLQQAVLNHFLDAGHGVDTAHGQPPSSTRIMIFAHYRDSAEEIARVLRRHEPMIRPHVFVGQQTSKGSEGMDQKRQQKVIEDFKSGKYNTLVATSIGEEGLDIGEIDLIICYDSSASPIRMLQRMGRTGRKRAGNILLLLMKGKEERSFSDARDNYEKMQKIIADGAKFEFHEETDRRIVPKGLDPVVDKRVVEIPIENTQADLPEPKKRGRAPKRPPKRFNMPDGVRTGFTKASRMDASSSDGGFSTSKSRKRGRPPKVVEDLEPIAPLNDVLLTKAQDDELFRNYQDIPCADGEEVFIKRPSLTKYPREQRVLRPSAAIKHGRTTKSVVSALQAMRSVDEDRINTLKRHSREINLERLCKNPRVLPSDVEESEPERVPLPKRKFTKAPPHPKRVPATKNTRVPRAAPREQAAARVPGARGARAYLDAAEGSESSPPPTDPRFAMATQGIELGSDTSGEEEVEAEPSSELREFIVEDDELGSETDGGLTSSIEVVLVDRVSCRASASKTTTSSAPSVNESADDDGDLPSLNTIVRTHIRTAPARESQKRRADTGIDPERARGKRKVIDDSSD